MAKRKSKSGAAFGVGIIIAILGLLGIGEFGIGNFEGGLVSDVFAPADEVVNEEELEGMYFAEIMVVDSIVTLNGEETAIEDLSSSLADASGKTVLLIDGGATHATWEKVVDTMNKLDCIVQTQ